MSALAAAARAYLDAEAQPAYSWVIESREARREGRPNREVERMERIARARVVLEEALLAEVDHDIIADGEATSLGALLGRSEP